MTDTILKDINHAAGQVKEGKIIQAYNLIKNDMTWFDYVGTPALKTHVRATHHGVLHLSKHLKTLASVPAGLESALQKIAKGQGAGLDNLKHLMAGIKTGMATLEHMHAPLVKE